VEHRDYDHSIRFDPIVNGVGKSTHLCTSNVAIHTTVNFRRPANAIEDLSNVVLEALAKTRSLPLVPGRGFVEFLSCAPKERDR